MKLNKRWVNLNNVSQPLISLKHKYRLIFYFKVFTNSNINKNLRIKNYKLINKTYIFITFLISITNINLLNINNDCVNLRFYSYLYNNKIELELNMLYKQLTFIKILFVFKWYLNF